MKLKIVTSQIPKFGEFDLRVEGKNEDLLFGACFSYRVKKEGALRRELITAIKKVVIRHNSKKAVKND